MNDGGVRSTDGSHPQQVNKASNIKNDDGTFIHDTKNSTLQLPSLLAIIIHRIISYFSGSQVEIVNHQEKEGIREEIAKCLELNLDSIKAILPENEVDLNKLNALLKNNPAVVQVFKSYYSSPTQTESLRNMKNFLVTLLNGGSYSVGCCEKAVALTGKYNIQGETNKANALQFFYNQIKTNGGKADALTNNKKVQQCLDAVSSVRNRIQLNITIQKIKPEDAKLNNLLLHLTESLFKGENANLDTIESYIEKNHQELYGLLHPPKQQILTRRIGK